MEENKFQPLNAEIYEAYNQFRPEGHKPLFCYVPFSNMSFSFEGRVLACAYNQKVELGQYPHQSIKEMWFESEEGNRLRQHMKNNDLSFGCKHCKYFFDNKKFSGLKPLVFDKYSSISNVGYPKVLEFELSNTCNLECVMCNGRVSSSVRQNRDKLPPIPMVYDDVFIHQLEEFIPHIEEAKFYGGEPFLIPIYYKIWEEILRVNSQTRIFTITNGTTLNTRIKDMLERGNFDLAVSLDATNKAMLEAIRVNTKYGTVLSNVNYFNDYCKSRGKNLVISYTLMRINWREFTKVIEFCNKVNASLYVSYLKTPPHLAVWNLPHEEIEHILESIGGMDIPQDTHAQRNNAQCYMDLLIYLKNCIQVNKVRPQEEIIPMATTHSVNSISISATDFSSNSNTSANGTEYIGSKNYKEEVMKIWSMHQKLLISKNLSGSNALYRIQSVLDNYFPEVDSNKIYFYLSITEPEVAVKDINTFSDTELRNAIVSLT